MKLVTVRNQLTLEEVGVTFELDAYAIRRLARNEPREDEASHYQSLVNDLAERVTLAEENPEITGRVTDRQIYVAYPPVKGTKLYCISMVQLLLGREENSTVVAVMRSSSTRRLASDLGLFSRIAQRYDCQRVLVTIGSFHVELYPQEL